MLLLELLLFFLELFHVEFTIAEHANVASTLLRSFELLLIRVASLPLGAFIASFHGAELAADHFLDERRVHFSAATRALTFKSFNSLELFDNCRVVRVNGIYQLKDRVVRSEPILFAKQVNVSTSSVLFTEKFLKLFSFLLDLLVRYSGYNGAFF
jgi:hypothetical protein